MQTFAVKFGLAVKNPGFHLLLISSFSMMVNNLLFLQLHNLSKKHFVHLVESFTK